MLYDENFLRELDESREKITYAKIISLDLEENPIEQVEGRITSGSINVDGNSAVRRTCSLTMVSQDMNLVNYQWGLNTKFKLEIGIQNVVSYKGHYDQYPDIIWFKLGTYVITSINISKELSRYILSASLETLNKLYELSKLKGDFKTILEFILLSISNIEGAKTKSLFLPLISISKLIQSEKHRFTVSILKTSI